MAEVRYVAKPTLSREHCFAIGRLPSSLGSILMAYRKPPFVRTPGWVQILDLQPSQIAIPSSCLVLLSQKNF